MKEKLVDDVVLSRRSAFVTIAANDKSKLHSNATRRAAEVNAKNFCPRAQHNQWGITSPYTATPTLKANRHCKNICKYKLLDSKTKQPKNFI